MAEGDIGSKNGSSHYSLLRLKLEIQKLIVKKVKVLSMSRLGGTGAVAPLIADIPSEDHKNGKFRNVAGIPSSDPMVVTECQVARLMEHDMGSAMQYLQSKGLCLMPTSLATAISTTKSIMQSNVQGGVQFLSTNLELDALTATGMTNSSNTAACAMPVSSAATCTNVTLSDSTSRGGNGS